MMRENQEFRSTEPDDRDERMQQVLSSLDPAVAAAGYWKGFHREVMDAARLELARRRRLADLTVAGTVTSWARAVVPSALVAAAAAAVVLLAVPAPPQVVEVDVGIAELLSVGLEGDPIPAELDDPTMSVILAAAEIF